MKTKKRARAPRGSFFDDGASVFDDVFIG